MKLEKLHYLFILLTVGLISCSKDDVNDSRALDAIQYATLTTKAVTNISQVDAKSGGTISNDGGADITARGICWSTSQNPTILDSYTSDGTGNGSFTSTITGLSAGTTYYVRAYATNEAGTSYGDQLSFSTPVTLSIGLIYQGGIIFYLDTSGAVAHGLVCAANDQSDSADWGCPTTTISGADAANIGTGQQNTIDILASCPTATAAYICDTLTLNGYTDWFLPSKWELDSMHNQLKLAGLGNFSAVPYWSSTEFITKAWVVIFNGGIYQGIDKDNFIYVRAVRAF